MSDSLATSDATPINTGERASLQELQARVERLESQLIHWGTTSWLLEPGQLPTG